MQSEGIYRYVNSDVYSGLVAGDYPEMARVGEQMYRYTAEDRAETQGEG
jgi:hypothetical protein